MKKIIIRKKKELAEKKQRMKEHKKSIKETNNHIKKYTNSDCSPCANGKMFRNNYYDISERNIELPIFLILLI